MGTLLQDKPLYGMNELCTILVWELPYKAQNRNIFVFCIASQTFSANIDLVLGWKENHTTVRIVVRNLVTKLVALLILVCGGGNKCACYCAAREMYLHELLNK